MNLVRISVVVLAVVAAVLVLLPAAPADAHAAYESSSPARGEQLAVAPTQVEITFTQELQKIAGSYDIAVNKDRGPSVTAGPAMVNDDDRTKLSVPLMADLADGRYVVNWKNLSDADGDRKEGAFSFYLNYAPNAVDLANDAQLEQVGSEVDATTSANETAVVTTTARPATNATAVAETAMSASPTSTESSPDEGDDNGAIVTILFVVVVVVVFLGGILVLRRSRNQ